MFRRPSFGLRRLRHRGLLKTGYLCLVLAIMAGLLWWAVATNEFGDDAADGRVFMALTAAFAVAAATLLAAWWYRAGQPPR